MGDPIDNPLISGVTIDNAAPSHVFYADGDPSTGARSMKSQTLATLAGHVSPLLGYATQAERDAGTVNNKPLSPATSRVRSNGTSHALAVGRQDLTGLGARAVVISPAGNSTAAGQHAVSIGYATSADGLDSFAAVNGATADFTGAISIGAAARVAAAGGISIGRNSDANSGVAIGNGTQALGGGAVGILGTASQFKAVAIRGTATASRAIGVGDGAIASGNWSIAQGWATTATGTASTSIGYHADALGTNSSSYGHAAQAKAGNSTAVGFQAEAAANAVAAGWNAHADGDSSASFGRNANCTVTATGSVAIGACTVSGGSSVGIRGGASGLRSLAILGTASGQESIATGHLSTATQAQSASYGYNARSTGIGALALGSAANASGRSSVAMPSATASADYAVAIGHTATTSVSGTVEIHPTNGGRFRMDSQRVHLHALTKIDAAPTDGGATEGAEDVGSLARGTIGLQVTTGDALEAYHNHNGTVTKLSLGGGGGGGTYASQAETDAGTEAAKAIAPATSRITFSRNASDALEIGLRSTTTNRGDASINIQTRRASAVNVASGDRSICVGENTLSSHLDSMALMTGARATATNSAAIGNTAQASAADAFAGGRNSVASGSRAVALAFSAVASGAESVSIGYHADATATYATAIGRSANATAQGAVSVGDSNARGANDVAIGTSASTATGTTAGVAIGNLVNASSQFPTAVGNQSQAGQRGSAFGYLAVANGGSGTALGAQTTASGISSLAAGKSCSATASTSVSVGQGNTVSGQTSSAFGSGHFISSADSIAVGRDCDITSTGNLNGTFGTATKISGAASQATAVGATCTVTNGSRNAVFGAYVTTSQAFTCEIGAHSSATARLSGFVRTDSTRVHIGASKTNTAPTDGGTTKGAEANGTLTRGAIAFQVDTSDNLIIYYNDAGTIKTRNLGLMS